MLVNKANVSEERSQSGRIAISRPSVNDPIDYGHERLLVNSTTQVIVILV